MTTARLLRCSCLCGLLGSLLMLTGDMLFYGSWLSGRDFSSFHEMSLKPVTQLVIAGSIGPIAGIFYALGMGVFYLILQSAGKRLAAVAAGLLAATMLIGGAYHAVFTTFGFAARVADPATRAALTSQIYSLYGLLSGFTYVTGIPGTALVFLLALRKRTLFPRWLLVFMPTLLSLGSQVFHDWLLMIPAPLGGVIRGGWINGSFVLFFAIATCVFWTIKAPKKEIPATSIS